MDKFKQQIELQLIANILKNKCLANSSLIFNEAWCTQDRIIRFTSPILRQLFPTTESGHGKLDSGDVIMYEVHNQPNSLEIICTVDCDSLSMKQKTVLSKIASALGIMHSSFDSELILKKWIVGANKQDINDLFEKFDVFTENDRVQFENSLLSAETAKEDDLIEGAPDEVFSTKYERNAAARKKCLEYHGTACKVCGIDFAKAYGPEFAGKIEVHHIVPLSQIGEEYVVDPINDLVPVCPNCHTALHSKKNGAYTIEELRQLRSQV